jgi:hypothetical protein
MFIRPCYRTKDGKRHAYWALVESYRSKRGPRQRTVAYLGQLDQQERLGIRQTAEGDPQSYQRHLFDDVEPQWVEVDLKGVRVERCLEFGGPWLAVQLLEQLGLSSVLKGLLPTRSGIEIRRRCITEPTDHQAALLQRLGLYLPSHSPVAERKMKGM